MKPKITRNGKPVTGKVAQHVSTIPPYIEWNTVYRPGTQNTVIEYEEADISYLMPSHLENSFFASIRKYGANYHFYFREDLTVMDGYWEYPDDDADYQLYIGYAYNPAPWLLFTKLHHAVVEKHWSQVLSSMWKYVDRYVYMRENGRIEKVTLK